MKRALAAAALTLLLTACGSAATTSNPPSTSAPAVSAPTVSAPAAAARPANAASTSPAASSMPSTPPIIFYKCSPPDPAGASVCDNADGSIQVDLTPMSTGVRFSVTNSRDHSKTPVYILGLAGNWARIKIDQDGSGSFAGMSFIVNRYGDGSFAVGSFFSPVI